MLIIQDKKLCRDLEEIAEITHQSVEELISDLILDQVTCMPLNKKQENGKAEKEVL